MALDEPRGWIALILGLLIAALGIIPLLGEWGVIGFSLPAGILNVLAGIAIWLIAGVALFLFIDALREDAMIRTISVIVAVVLLALGVIQILSGFGIIGFSLPLGPVVYYILLAVEGIFLFIAAFAMD